MPRITWIFARVDGAARIPGVLRRLAVVAALALLVAAWPARAAAPTVDADA